jgi:phage tail sheath protein FI
MAGIYARSDIERGVHKAPANETVRGILRFSRNVTKGEQDVLNPEGINAFRYFEGRGLRIWGARTISSDPEWIYLNVRRLFIFLEHSIDRGTQWAVFEPNNEELWLKVRLTIESFLTDVWRTGALMGTRPEEAFFVRCDRTTMSQGDLDNGRLVVLIGVAPTKPAEFVIFRIGQWTADASLV